MYKFPEVFGAKNYSIPINLEDVSTIESYYQLDYLQQTIYDQEEFVDLVNLLLGQVNKPENVVQAKALFITLRNIFQEFFN